MLEALQYRESNKKKKNKIPGGAYAAVSVFLLIDGEGLMLSPGGWPLH